VLSAVSDGVRPNTSSVPAASVDLQVTPGVYDEVTSRLRRSGVHYDVTIDDLQRQAACYFAVLF